MKRSHITLVFTIMVMLSSCVSMSRFSETRDRLEAQNHELSQLNAKLDTENTELKSVNNILSEKNRDISARLESALYELNTQKQKSDFLEEEQKRLNREMDLLKSGSTSEIEMLLKELQTIRNDLNQREDRLQEAEKELEIRNKRLIELQDILTQKDQAVKDLKEKVMNALTGFNNNGLTVHEKNGKVYVSMDEKLLFKTGKWDVDPKGQQAIADLSNVLAQNPDINIMVEGHTDDVPMHGSGEVKDNWDLSVMRATAVTKILTRNKQIDPQRIIAAGRSEYVPLVSEKTPEARQMNRRTEIILTPRLDELLKIIEMN